MMASGERWMEAGLGLWRLSVQMAETMIASQAVIASRMTMMARAGGDPSRLPHVEMRRMGTEKLTAFGRGHADATRILGKTMVDDGMIALALVERTLDASAAWWSPLHRTATANAKRLGRRRS